MSVRSMLARITRRAPKVTIAAGSATVLIASLALCGISLFVIHCHVANHEERGMMSAVQVVR